MTRPFDNGDEYIPDQPREVEIEPQDTEAEVDGSVESSQEGYASAPPPEMTEDGGAGGFGASPVHDSSGDEAPEGTRTGGLTDSRSLGETAGSFGYSMAGAGIAAGRNAAGAARRMFTKVASMAVSAGTSLAGATGGAMSPAVGTGIVGSGVVAMLLAVGMIFGTVVTNLSPARKDEILECVMPEKKEEKSDMMVGGDTEENAKKIYSVFKYAGMSDENIAGILGNWTVESNIDPTSVETIFTEPFKLGPRKQAAEAADFKMTAINAGYAARFPRINRAGIGLGAWTDVHPGPGGRNTMLREFAEANNKDWYDLELQLAFTLGADDPYRVKIIEGMIDESKGNPEQAAIYFLEKWEGIHDHSAGRRQEAAADWYLKMQNWDVDESLGASVMAMADMSRKSANSKEMQRAAEECAQESTTGGNDTIAEAWASYAWPYQMPPNEPNSLGNDGTELYIFLKDEIFPGDPWYRSCDRSVATGVRWAGADDAFPEGNTLRQYQYLTGPGRDKWEEMGYDRDTPESEFRPGDVIVTKGDGHIQGYIGKEAIEKVWGNKPHEKDATMIAGSLNNDNNPKDPTNRSPGLQHFRGFTSDDRSYNTFRLKGDVDPNSKYKKIKIPAGTKGGPDY